MQECYPFFWQNLDYNRAFVMIGFPMRTSKTSNLGESHQLFFYIASTDIWSKSWWAGQSIGWQKDVNRCEKIKSFFIILLAQYKIFQNSYNLLWVVNFSLTVRSIYYIETFHNPQYNGVKLNHLHFQLGLNRTSRPVRKSGKLSKYGPSGNRTISFPDAGLLNIGKK